MDVAEQNLTIHVQKTEVINYALQQNKLPIIQRLVLHNSSDQSFEDVTLKIKSTPEIIKAVDLHIEILPAQSDFEVKELSVVANGEFLVELTERLEGTIEFTVLQKDIVLSKESQEITALAFDEWHGPIIFPELLVSFVTPNHPEISRVCHQAARLLEQWSSDPSLNAYQTKNPERVVLQTAAVYGALQMEDIIYSVPPASFEAIGQRVRLVDAILGQKMGTCLDLTLLYAACLEYIGLHPILLLQKGHIFVGVWLEENTFSESIGDDPSQITKRLADGVNEIMVVECTSMVSGKHMNFDQAVEAGVKNLTDLESLELIIDVKRARLSGIRPLPIRILEGGVWKIQTTESKEDWIQAPSNTIRQIHVGESAAIESTGKIAQWERKLLDIGLRNTLINMRLSQSIVPLLYTDLYDLEDSLAKGGEYGISPRLAEWASTGKEESFESWKVPVEYQELLKAEFSNRRLRSTLTEVDLEHTIKILYRSSKTSLEENGANTLYLAFGLLRWYETKASQKPRYAPLVLLPIEIIRKAANRGYIIRLRDEDPQMNITLLEMLKQDFGIHIQGLDPLPQDDHGIDIRSVFTIIRKAIMGQNQWDIIEASCLGIFSFSQFVMWNDLRNRSEELQQNKIVKSLINGQLSWDAQPMEMGETVSEEGVLLPIPVDASQLYAIKRAAEGESFVLHGPPGTGKSQTITAMISNALAQGKTVLFVAEKMAALDVVQRRLHNIGLGPFCLELHSNKSKKSSVLEQLRMATEIGKVSSTEEYQKRLDQIANLRKELDGYKEALHRKQKSGLNLYQMVNGYESYRHSEETIHLPLAMIREITEELREEQKQFIERILAAGKMLGHPHKHPLAVVKNSNYSQMIRSELGQYLREYDKALNYYEGLYHKIERLLGVGELNGYSDLLVYHSLVEELSHWTQLPKQWASYKDQANSLYETHQMSQYYQEAVKCKEKLLIDWTEGFLGLAAERLLQEWKTLQDKNFVTKLFAEAKILKEIKGHYRKTKVKEALPHSLELLVKYQKNINDAKAVHDRYLSDIASITDGTTIDWAIIGKQADDARKSILRLRDNRLYERVNASLSVAKDYPREFQEYIDAFQQLEQAKTNLYDLLMISQKEEADWINGERNLIVSIEEHKDQLKEWMVYQGLANEARKYKLDSFVEAYESGMVHEKVMNAYMKGLYEGLIVITMDSEPILQSFSGMVFHEKIEQFKRLDRDITKLASQEVFYRLASRVPNMMVGAAGSSEVGILQRAIRSGGRGISIRKLFEQIPNLLPRLAPCMLMSPISAAQYLDPKRTPFDLVIFDEASQMPTCKAVGALARGNNAIIVGDPKQMPPTTFFMGNMVDEDNLETEDLESILDDCLALNLPQSHLLWHYRSRHESLIAFSNNQFYESKLYTFPSVNDRESKVRLVTVGGYFDRGKTRQNRAEALAIVDELVRRCYDSKDSKLSVGIVTFNIPQQNLIEDLFLERCKEDIKLDEWANTGLEPLFIKNLENVQGDERDVILFSVGYGPDKEGKVFMNFGPLNREGGWRRLNVAVSRSRHEMVVFSTLGADQINLSRSSSEGVAALKAFLEYAGNNSLSENAHSTGERITSYNGIVDEISHVLSKAGYQGVKNIGSSSYRIDLAIIDPRNGEQYILGVLLDGPVYGSGKTTRDREIGQISVLQGLGWNIHRIWTVDWWDNKEKEIQRLIIRVKELELETSEPKSELNPSEVDTATDDNPIKTFIAGDSVIKHKLDEEATISVEDKVYVASKPQTITITPEEFMLPQTATFITRAIQQIIEEEAPITESLLYRKLLQSFGISRAGTRMQGRISEILSHMNMATTAYQEQITFWKKEEDAHCYQEFRIHKGEEEKRDAKDIPVREIYNAILQVLKEQIGLPKEDLIREVSKRFGYARIGSNVNLSVSSGISFALEQGSIREDDKGYITLKDNN